MLFCLGFDAGCLPYTAVGDLLSSLWWWAWILRCGEAVAWVCFHFVSDIHNFNKEQFSCVNDNVCIVGIRCSSVLLFQKNNEWTRDKILKFANIRVIFVMKFVIMKTFNMLWLSCLLFWSMLSWRTENFSFLIQSVANEKMKQWQKVHYQNSLIKSSFSFCQISQVTILFFISIALYSDINA